MSRNGSDLSHKTGRSPSQGTVTEGIGVKTLSPAVRLARRFEAFVSSVPPARTAVILAAGNGDRFKNGNHHSKLLHPVAGQPLILRTLRSAAAAGVSSFCFVVGFEADRVRALVEAERPAGIEHPVRLQPGLAPRERPVGAGGARVLRRAAASRS